MVVEVTKVGLVLLVCAKVLRVVPVVLISVLLRIQSSSVDVSMRVLCPYLGALSVIPMVVVSLSEEAHLFVLSVVVLQHLVLPNLAMSWRLPALELH
jgi:hypothetical protein